MSVLQGTTNHPSRPGTALAARRLRTTARLIAFIFILTLLAPAFLPGTQAIQTGRANILFEADIDAPVHAVDGDRSASQVAVIDDDATVTAVLGRNEAERRWTAPTKGQVTTFPPRPVAVAFADHGNVWAAAIAYESTQPGMVVGFSSWSDGPIWTLPIPSGADESDPSSLLATADQPTTLAAGGNLFAVGTKLGHVYLFTADDTSDAGQKQPFRHYWRDNDRQPFGEVTSLAISATGDKVVIGTAASGRPSLHVFSDQFFIGSFENIQSPVHHVAVSADGSAAAVSSGTAETTRLSYLDLDSGKTVWENTDNSASTALALNETGDVLAVGSADGALRVYQRTGSFNDREPIHATFLGADIIDLGITLDGTQLAAATSSGELTFITPLRKDPLWRYTAPGDLAGIVLADSGDRLVLATREDQVGRIVVTAADHSLDVVAPKEYGLVPGIENTLSMSVTNSGNRMARVTAEWGALPERWSGTGVALILAPGETGTFRALLRLPSGEPAGKHEIPMTLLPYRPLTADQVMPKGTDAGFVGRVAEVQGGHAALVWSMPMAVPGGSPSAFMLKLENRGNIQDRVAMGYAQIPGGWQAAFDTPTEIILNPGETREVVFRVAAPPHAVVGQTAYFELIMAWDHGEQRIDLSTAIVDVPTYLERLGLDAANTTEAAKAHGVNPATIGALAESLETERQLADVGVATAESEDSPGPALVLLLGVLVGTVGFLRRRR